MRSFALRDHKCPELEKLLEEKLVSYKWGVCDCSPCERHYQILEAGKWRDMVNCVFCGVLMAGKFKFHFKKTKWFLIPEESVELIKKTLQKFIKNSEPYNPAYSELIKKCLHDFETSLNITDEVPEDFKK